MKTADELKQKAYVNGVFTFTENELDDYVTKVREESLDRLMFDFFKGSGFDKLAEAQSKASIKQKEIERQKGIKEQYEYLKWRKASNMDFSDAQQKEYDYCLYKCEIEPRNL